MWTSPPSFFCGAAATAPKSRQPCPVRCICAVQGRSPFLCPVLVTMLEDGEFVHIAQLLFPDVRFRQLLRGLGIAHRCFGSAPQITCAILHNQVPVTQDAEHRLHPAALILVTIFPMPPEDVDQVAAAHQRRRQDAPPTVLFGRFLTFLVRESTAPLVIMGDMDCRVGSVLSSGISDLLVPSTWAQYHQGL